MVVGTIAIDAYEENKSVKCEYRRNAQKLAIL